MPTCLSTLFTVVTTAPTMHNRFQFIYFQVFILPYCNVLARYTSPPIRYLQHTSLFATYLRPSITPISTSLVHTCILSSRGGPHRTLHHVACPPPVHRRRSCTHIHTAHMPLCHATQLCFFTRKFLQGFTNFSLTSARAPYVCFHLFHHL